ncbi:MAG: septation protein A [Proteobacteria bacterium]|nr:septation protein A [Pseudomonadota bacterium]
MKIFFDLLPVILFFASYHWASAHKELVAQGLTQHLGFAVSGGVVGLTEAPTLLATVVVIVATVLQIVVLKALRKPVDKMLWAGLVIVVVLGGLTLWFHDERFIKWKPTLIYWMMSAGFLVTEILLGRKMLRQMMGGQIEAPDAVWRSLGWAWVLFFAGMGVLNLYVAFNFATDTWVSFKMWGSLGLTLAFTLAQGVYLSKHVQPVEAGGSQ